MSTPSTNLQACNVGNLGDILKHAALLELASLLAERNSQAPINYLETHTFQLQAACSDSIQWDADVRSWQAKHPRYSKYFDAERTHLAKGQYRCSCGLVKDILPKYRLYLAEEHEQTRDALRAQLAQEQSASEVLLNNAAGFAFFNAVKEPGPLLALVDPFKDLSGIWGAVGQACSALRGPHADGIVEVFQYCFGGKVSWPKGPESFDGPIATLSRLDAKHIGCTFELAVYATSDVALSAGQTLTELGW